MTKIIDRLSWVSYISAKYKDLAFLGGGQNLNILYFVYNLMQKSKVFLFCMPIFIFIGRFLSATVVIHKVNLSCFCKESESVKEFSVR